MTTMTMTTTMIMMIMTIGKMMMIGEEICSKN